MAESYFLENSHPLSWADTINRHIISMKSRGFFQTPQDIMEEYNGCSVTQYIRYGRMRVEGIGRKKNLDFDKNMGEAPTVPQFELSKV